MVVSVEFDDDVLVKISKHIGHERRRLSTLLGLEPPQVDQIEQKHGNDPQHINFSILKVS